MNSRRGNLKKYNTLKSQAARYLSIKGNDYLADFLLSRVNVEFADTEEICYSISNADGEIIDRGAIEEALGWASGLKAKELAPYYTANDRAVRRGKANGNTGAFPKSVIKRMLAAVAVLAMIALVILGGFFLHHLIVRNDFETSYYHITTWKAYNNVRAALISDMHNSVFGDNNEAVTESIRKATPDIIIMAGDMADAYDETNEPLYDFIEDISDIAPIVYIYGNHEADTSFDCFMSLEELDEVLGVDEDTGSAEDIENHDDPFRDKLESLGVDVLLNKSKTYELNGVDVDIYGILTTDHWAFQAYGASTFDEYINDNYDHLKICVAHEPYLYEGYSETYWGDVAFAGHTHGGVMRIPGVGGLYEHRHGFLPELKSKNVYMAGQYTASDYTPLIVTRGLTNRDLFRVNNTPEFCIVDINRY